MMAEKTDGIKVTATLSCMLFTSQLTLLPVKPLARPPANASARKKYAIFSPAYKNLKP
jgi:hypothetical protein